MDKQLVIGSLLAAFVLMTSSAFAEIPIPSSSSPNIMQNKQKSLSDLGQPRIVEVGDRVEVRIYPEDDYIKGVEMQIGSEGNVILPLIGKVKIVGMTVQEAQMKLVKIIDADYLVNPEVIIEIKREELAESEKRFLNISVLGAVRSPNNYPMEIKEDAQSITLIQAILNAGGFSDVANIKKIKIIRKQGGSNRVIKANAESIISGKATDVDLEEGDIIHVGESLF